MMTKEDFQQLLSRYLEGKSTEAEKTLLHEFYEVYQEDLSWDPNLGDQQMIQEQLLKDIHENIAPEEKQSKWVLMPLVKIAASIVLVLTVGVLAREYMFDHAVETVQISEKSTQFGQKSTIVLSDGSEIRLNSGSKLTYPSRFLEDKREVYLTGEAFFDVSRDVHRPFIIHTGEVTTTVLGTSFNVKAFAEDALEVTVATGKVQVAKDQDNSDRVILTPGEQALFEENSQNLIKRKVDLDAYLGWKSGEIRFENATLGEAALILERWYGVTIVFENSQLKKCEIRNGVYKDENLYTILKSFEFFLDVNFRLDQKNLVILSGKGCK